MKNVQRAKSIVAPYGSWRSPISADLIVTETMGLGMIVLDGADTYWIEMRPTEGGRSVIVRHTAEGVVADITPQGFNARTRVHEYGGGDFTVHNGAVYFTNFTDQRLYRQAPGAAPEPITSADNKRYADLVVDKQRQRLICVCEDHSGLEREAINTLVSIPLDNNGGIHTLVAGNDFYSSARLSPDGTHLAWLTWNHPNMPWDGTELWVGELDENGFIGRAEYVAGGPNESIFQPTWSPAGVLHFISDRTGWWNLYRWGDEQVEPLYPKKAEFGVPQWQFATATYGFAAEQSIICWYAQNGGHLARLHTATGTLTPLDMPYTVMRNLCVDATRAVFIGASATQAPSIVQLDLATYTTRVLRKTSTATIDPAYLSVPKEIEFPTERGLMAYGLFYAPRNPDYHVPEGELPPLIVRSHGGPTSAASSALNLGIQYWTSRGFAVLDVNYGGSTGYGRAYRERLNGQWGIVDVDDCVKGAKYLVERGLVDSKRLAITGGSAGGYTTLCALTFRDTFKVGASHFGVSDLTTFVHDTHKFEARYLYSLVGPYPERADLYSQRSPINFVDRISCPIIFFQGLEDKIVPPSQAEVLVEALRAKKLPVAYLPFEGEQHGFRRAQNIKRALEGELYFYAKNFGFELADCIEPVVIDNL
ncbi:MAG: S9 family peptidase [Chloroflexi bacterium]|nr:MAG: S9 family peptidase [Chloroflexota bacterium]